MNHKLHAAISPCPQGVTHPALQGSGTEGCPAPPHLGTGSEWAQGAPSPTGTWRLVSASEVCRTVSKKAASHFPSTQVLLPPCQVPVPPTHT